MSDLTRVSNRRDKKGSFNLRGSIGKPSKYDVFIGTPSAYRTAHRHYVEVHNEYDRYIAELSRAVISDLIGRIYDYISLSHAKRKIGAAEYVVMLSSLRFKCYCQYENDDDSDENVDTDERHYEHNVMKRIIEMVYRKVIDLMTLYEDTVLTAIAEDIEQRKADNEIIIDGMRETGKANNVDETRNKGCCGLYYEIHQGMYGTDNTMKTENSKILIKFLMSQTIIGKTPKHPLLIIGMQIGNYIIGPPICESKTSSLIQVKNKRIDGEVDQGLQLMKIGIAGTKVSGTMRTEAKMISCFDDLPYLPSYKSFGIYTDGAKQHSYFVMPMYGYDLYELVIGNEDHRVGMDNRTVTRIVWQLVQALKYLHDNSIIHNDVKPENIVLENSDIDTNASFLLPETKEGKPNHYLNIVLIDYGLSKDNSKFAHKKTSIRGTISYLSPEELAGSAARYESDIWSMGVVALELICGYSVFSDDILRNMFIIEAMCGYFFTNVNDDVCSNKELVSSRLKHATNTDHDIMKRPINVKYIESVVRDELMRDLIRGCLDPLPDRRYTAQQLYYHPIFKRYRDLENKSNQRL